MSRSLRALSILTRTSNFSQPLKRSLHASPQHTGDVKAQSVRLKTDSRKRAKRFCYQIAILSAYSYCLLRFIENEEEELSDNSKAESEDDDVQIPDTPPEDALFIPLGLVRQRPHMHYKGSDPEWQSFVEFGNDRERPAAVRKELVDTICSNTDLTESLKRYIGIPIKPGKVWLDIVIPPGPAPEYERSGLEIADEYIAWTTRPVPALQVARLHSALMPLPAAKSLWASTNTYYSLQVAKLKEFLKITPASSENSPQLSIGTINIEQPQKNTAKQKTQTRSQMDKISDPKTDISSTKESAETGSSDDSRIYGSLPSLPRPSSDVAAFVTEFKRTLAKTWRPPYAYGERGTFIVRGQLELQGPAGSCVLEVHADYHPREATYRTMRVHPLYILPYRQRPRPP